MKKIIVLSFLITAIFHFSGKIFGFYKSIWEFDSLIHFLGGIFAGSLGIYYARKKKKNSLICAILFSFIIGALWELYWRYVQHNIYPPSDTILDMILDVAGGVTLVFFLKIKERKKRTKMGFPLGKPI